MLGANDGIVSTASLLVGVAAADASHGALLTAGIAGAVAGAMSMAAGEYVSVSSQADTEQADLARERRELETDDAGEHRELMGIYMGRGLNQRAREAGRRSAHGARRARRARARRARHHGSVDGTAAAGRGRLGRKLRGGALLPLVVAALVPVHKPRSSRYRRRRSCFSRRSARVAARAGGARDRHAAARVTFWGALAMAATAGIGQLFGTIV